MVLFVIFDMKKANKYVVWVHAVDGSLAISFFQEEMGLVGCGFIASVLVDQRSLFFFFDSRQILREVKVGFGSLQLGLSELLLGNTGSFEVKQTSSRSETSDRRYLYLLIYNENLYQCNPSWSYSARLPCGFSLWTDDRDSCHSF